MNYNQTLLPTFTKTRYDELLGIKLTEKRRPWRPSLYVRRHGLVECHKNVWSVSQNGLFQMDLFLREQHRQALALSYERDEWDDEDSWF